MVVEDQEVLIDRGARKSFCMIQVGFDWTGCATCIYVSVSFWGSSSSWSRSGQLDACRNSLENLKFLPCINFSERSLVDPS